MARKRRAISVKGGAYRTSARTPDHFTTVLDATILSSAPNNTNTNYHTNNAMQDLMNPHAAPAVANATIAEPRARTPPTNKKTPKICAGRLQVSVGAV
jgi:hypothetical protein